MKSQDFASVGDAATGEPPGQEHGQTLAPVDLPPDVQALLAEKERLEDELARLARHGAPRPEEERMKRMYPVRVHTKESRIEDRRLRRHDEQQRMLKQRVLDKKLIQARERQHQEELEAQRKRRGLEAALARVRAQARAAEEEAQQRRKMIEKVLAAARAERRQAERAAEQERKEIEQALVQARWENDRRKALAARVRARRREAIEQELDLGRRRARAAGRATESTQPTQAADWVEVGPEKRQDRALPARTRDGMAIEQPAGVAGRPVTANSRLAQKKLEDHAWEQARERQREQAQERRRAEQELAARLDRRSKSRAGDDARA